MNGITLPAESRAIVFYGAANRDGSTFPDAHSLDITRDSINHLAFGAGPNVCAGINLTRLEMKAIFSSLAKMVRRFHIEHEERIWRNYILRYPISPRSSHIPARANSPAGAHRCRRFGQSV